MRSIAGSVTGSVWTVCQECGRYAWCRLIAEWMDGKHATHYACLRCRP